ncbi:hypothetical protein STIAU_5936 [Stigmatella aurantiaca DW4/3-1]|uniref:Uncharacterized protein n=1 Tax=Stigmatella aurantiaca (strain DW4/3-1) TaxID=378806 RepID=Q08V66_STIAD|nr:hypothetical protein STIAU_5936 [Stigmatella aurantiaca DW4/3-1]
MDVRVRGGEERDGAAFIDAVIVGIQRVVPVELLHAVRDEDGVAQGPARSPLPRARELDPHLLPGTRNDFPEDRGPLGQLVDEGRQGHRVVGPEGHQEEARPQDQELLVNAQVQLRIPEPDAGVEFIGGEAGFELQEHLGNDEIENVGAEVEVGIPQLEAVVVGDISPAPLPLPEIRGDDPVDIRGNAIAAQAVSEGADGGGSHLFLEQLLQALLRGLGGRVGGGVPGGRWRRGGLGLLIGGWGRVVLGQRGGGMEHPQGEQPEPDAAPENGVNRQHRGDLPQDMITVLVQCIVTISPSGLKCRPFSAGAASGCPHHWLPSRTPVVLASRRGTPARSWARRLPASSRHRRTRRARHSAPRAAGGPWGSWTARASEEALRIDPRARGAPLPSTGRCRSCTSGHRRALDGSASRCGSPHRTRRSTGSRPCRLLPESRCPCSASGTSPPCHRPSCASSSSRRARCHRPPSGSLGGWRRSPGCSARRRTRPGHSRACGGAGRAVRPASPPASRE